MERVVRTDLDGFYNIMNSVLFSMFARRRGRIVAVASISGQVGQAGQVNYSAAKAGLIGACKALAREIGKRNICVNVVAPGIDRNRHDRQFPQGANSSHDSPGTHRPAGRCRFRRRISLPRAGDVHSWPGDRHQRRTGNLIRGKTMKTYDSIVVGSGITGLTAARILAQKRQARPAAGKSLHPRWIAGAISRRGNPLRRWLPFHRRFHR